MLKTGSEHLRIVWLDILRGVGISLVVLGHCLPECLMRIWIYNFHVPLLFMLSGYLNQALHGGSKRLRIRRILIPYAIWAILPVSLKFAFQSGDSSITSCLSDIIPFAGFTCWNRPLWFLYALFFVGILKPVWIVDWSPAGVYRFAKSCVPLVVFVLFVAIVSAYKPEWHNVFAWRNVLVGVVCYCLGEAVFYLGLVDKLASRLSAVLFFLLVGSCVAFLNGGLSIYGCRYGRSIGLLAVASVTISISLMVIFSCAESRVPKSFVLLGKCSLFIMVSHYFALKIFGALLRSLDLHPVSAGILEAVIVLVCYQAYFSLLSMLRVDAKLPDWLGGCHLENKKGKR